MASHKNVPCQISLFILGRSYATVTYLIPGQERKKEKKEEEKESKKERKIEGEDRKGKERKL